MKTTKLTKLQLAAFMIVLLNLVSVSAFAQSRMIAVTGNC